MRFLVRPFEWTVDPGESALPYHVKGEIQEQGFTLLVNAAAFPLPTDETGGDERGPYAVIQDTDLPLPGGRWLTVNPDPPGDDAPDGPSGCTISLLMPNPEWIPSANTRSPQELSVPVKHALEFDFSPTGVVKSCFCIPQRSKTPPSIN